MRWIWAGTRAATALVVMVAVIATYATARRPVDPWNFFGFFTVQSNIAIAIALGWAAVGVATRHPAPPLLRGTVTVYIALTGLVYNTLLAGVAGGVALPWANLVLHSVVPAYAVLDWLLLPDRPALPWGRLWVVIPYPLVWLAVVLVRGATDGWVPYPFLDPGTGYASVIAYSLAIAVAVMVVGVAVWAVSRARLGGRAGIGDAPPCDSARLGRSGRSAP